MAVAARRRSVWAFRIDVAQVIALICFVIPLSAVTIVVGELIPKVLALKNPEWVCTTLSPLMWGFRLGRLSGRAAVGMADDDVRPLVERLLPQRKTDDHLTHLHELRAQVNLLRASQVIGMQEERIILAGQPPLDDEGQGHHDAGGRHRDGRGRCAAQREPGHRPHGLAHAVSRDHAEGDPQAIIGYVTFKDMVLLAKTHPGNPVIREIVRQIISLPEEMTLSEALRRMTDRAPSPGPGAATRRARSWA